MATPSKAPPNKAPPFYTDAKFREIIPLLNLTEYLKIEYLSKGVWFKMLSKRGNSYNCECCGVDNIGPTPVLEHVRGKKHRFALQAAEQLYHPSYTHPKKVNANAPARTPILDAYNAAAGVSAAPKNTKAAATAAAPKGTKAAALNKTNVQGQKPAVQQKAAAGTQQKQQKPQPKPAVVKKPANTTNKVEPAQAAATPKTSVVLNPAAVKTGESAPEQNQEKPEKTEKSAADSSVKQEVTKKPEETKVAANGNETKKEDSKVLEVVVLDDDDDVTVNEGSKPKIPEGQAISIISTATAKPQRPPRRNANAPPQVQTKIEPEVKPVDTLPPGTEGNEGDTTITTTKKVINPAAVVAKSGEQKDENTPRYQQNRVIIPTVDRTKKKSTPVQNKDVDEATQPSFSTKNYSQKTSSEIEGIIGVEYVVKILKVYNDPEPFYECCLCEVVMDGIGMQTHLLGYNHRYKYLEKHFPTCFNQYKEHIGNIQVMGIILDRIAKAVEAHHGRELPYECLSGEFRSNRHGVMTTVYSFRHASEYSGPSFTNVVDTKQVEEFYNKKNIYLPPKPDPKRKPTFDTRSGGTPVPKRSKVERPAGRNGNGGTRGGSRGSGGASSRRPYREEMENNTIDDAVHKQMVEEFLQNTRGRSRSPGGGRRRRHRSRSRSRSRSPHRSSRRRIQRRSVSPLREGDVWQAYRHLVDRSRVELDQMYRDYRKDPEKHPLYDEEWRKFWKLRKEQMAREGLDYRNYDFQPEWVRYFAVRIEELYDEAVEDIKISSRRRLILPMTNDELEDTRYHLKKVQEEEEPMMVLKSKPMPDYSEMSDKTSVVSVLRLLTALEDYLGSLGPRVVDLLSKALLVEKSNPGEINEIVLNLENCTILETAMEKLKGVLIAGLLEGPKVRAFNNVITETEKILRMAYKMRQRNPQPVPQPVPAPKTQLDYQPQKSSYLGSGSSFMQQQTHSMSGSNSGSSSTSGAAASLLSQIDKKELATKLAAALTAQGKTDFNPEQLQQLIAVYSLIDKKKRDSAAAADKQKMTLSDTLTALLNPSEKSGVGGGGGMSGSLTQPSSGRIGGNYSNNTNDRVGGPGSLSNSSITNFVSMLNRDNLSTGGSGSSGDTQMWQNLQNIQNSLRMQNSGGFGSNPMGSGSTGGVGGGGGSSGYLDSMSSSTNFSRGGGFGSGSLSGTGIGGGGFNLGQNSSMNFSRSASSVGGGRISGDNDGFQGNFQSMAGNNSSFSRGENDDMHGVGGGRGNMLGGRGGDNMLGGRGGVGGLSGTFSSGNLSGNMGGGGGGMGGGGGGMRSGSGGMGGGGGNFSRGTGGGGGMGGVNNSGFSRGGNDNFLGGGGRNNIGGPGSEGSGGGFGGNFSGSGLSSYSSAGGLGGNNNYQRGSGGMGGMSGGSGPLGNNSGGIGGAGNFGRGGGGSSNFGNSMNNSNSFNKNPGRNEGSGPAFGSNQRMGGNQSNQQPMGRNALGGLNNSQAGRGGSNWRNQ